MVSYWWVCVDADSNSHSHDRIGIYATFLHVGISVSVWCRASKETAHGLIFRAFERRLCGVKVGFPCCRCVREPPAPLKSVEPRISRIGRCILNHVLIIRRIFWVIKQKMSKSIAYVLLMYCLCIFGAFFSVFSCQ